MSRVPEIIAHRGYRETHAENTLAGFEAAIAAGADAVELDVQFCRDGTPVVLHDPHLERLTGQPGQLEELSYAELAAYSAHEPGRFGDRFRPTPIPTLEEVAEQLSAHQHVKVYVEIKRETLAHHAIPAGVERVLRDCRPLGERAVIISFDDGVLQQARALENVEVGWVLPEWSAAAQERAGVVEPDYLFVSERQLPPPSIPFWPGPWRWAVYEVNDPEAARRLVERGVEGIETASVTRLVQALHPKG